MAGGNKPLQSKSLSAHAINFSLSADSNDRVLAEHHMYIEGRATERENILAKEIRNVFCTFEKLKASHVIVLAQLNGFLAAEALEMPVCNRIQGNGRSLIVQKCKPRKVDIVAVQSQCGTYEPIFVMSNDTYVVGLDGFSIVKFNNGTCFWKNGVVDLNNQNYVFINNSWEKANSNIWKENVELVEGFNETIDNEFDFMIVEHVGTKSDVYEQLNVLNEMVSDLFSYEVGGDASMRRTSKNRFVLFIEWIKTIFASIALLSLVGFLITTVIARPSLVTVPMNTLKNYMCKDKRADRRQVTNPQFPSFASLELHAMMDSTADADQHEALAATSSV